MLAYDVHDDYEIIGGEKFMSPAPNPTHGRIIGRLYNFIDRYFDTNESGYVFSDNTDVHFPDGTLLKPDLCVVLEKIQRLSIGSEEFTAFPI